MELLPVIVLVCAIFKGHKWARRCRCEMGRKREARGVKRENACLGRRGRRCGGAAETPWWLQQRDGIFKKDDCRDSEFLQHHVKWLIMGESRDYFADE